jgi:hypothetical protein
LVSERVYSLSMEWSHSNRTSFTELWF